MLIMYCALLDDETKREQFIRLYNDNKDAMYRYAMAILKDTSLAEDALHDAFVRVASNISKVDFSRNTRALLLTIVKNISLTTLKKREHEILTEMLDERSEQISSAFAEEQLAAKSSVEIIARAVKEMPEKYSIVFRLRFAHDLTYAQIASLLDISVDAAKKRVQRVRERISELMEEDKDE